MMTEEQAYDDPQWYALRTHPKQEDRAEFNLRAWQVETFNPKMRERRYNEFSGKPTDRVKTMFPNYIFARFDADRLLSKVWYTRGVQSVVGFGSGPTPISGEMIDLFKSTVGDDGCVNLVEDIQPGDEVIVKSGPMKDLMGVFERGVKSTDRVIILLDAVNYQARVMVERHLVTRVAASESGANNEAGARP
jgi:transcriptional antiterminator RfaH